MVVIQPVPEAQHCGRNQRQIDRIHHRAGTVLALANRHFERRAEGFSLPHVLRMGSTACAF